jgi:excisionase family DNA binding protein
MKADHPKSPSKFYTIKQIADFVDVSTRTVRRWIKNGLLIAHRVNGLVRVSEVDFRVFLAAHRDI